MKITTFDQSKLSYLKSIYAILCIFIFSLITGCATGRVENYSKIYVTDLKDIGAKIKPLPIKTNKENTLANLVSFDGNKSPSINLNEKIKGFLNLWRLMVKRIRNLLFPSTHIALVSEEKLDPA